MSEQEQKREEEATRAALLAKLSPARKAFDLAAAARANCQEMLAATGQYSPSPQVGERVLMLRVAKQRLREVGDLWLAPEDLKDLTDGDAHHTLPAGCDAMYSDAWTFVWCQAPGRLRLWRKRNLVLEAANDEVWFDTGFLRPARTLAGPSLTRVRGWLADDWVKRGVSLELNDGEQLTVASKRELAAMIDPTYDGLDLLCDSSWVSDLARGLGETLGLPVKLDKDL